jgi:hypothetical protein
VSARPPAVKAAVRVERDRCSGLLSLTIRAIKEAMPASMYEHMPLVIAPLERLHRDFRIGKLVPAPKIRKRTRTVCSWCDGEEEPEGHNRATCPRRFRDIAAGKVKVAA